MSDATIKARKGRGWGVKGKQERMRNSLDADTDASYILLQEVVSVVRSCQGDTRELLLLLRSARELNCVKWLYDKQLLTIKLT